MKLTLLVYFGPANMTNQPDDFNDFQVYVQPNFYVTSL